MRAPITIVLARPRGRENDRFYFRVGNNDHVVLNRLIAERRLQADGLVIDARRHERHKTLRRYARETNISTCLDTQAMELAMPGATSKGHLELPWSKMHRPSAEYFTPKRIEQIVEAIVGQVVAGDYAEVKAPAHYVADAASEWPSVDVGITIGDSFDIGALQRPASPSTNRSFAPPQRVYMEVLGVAVEKDIATKLMSSPRGKLQFACKEKACCPDGSESMLGDMERHSAIARQRQYVELSRIPVSMRAEHFVHNVFSPVCDMLTRASDVHELFKKTQRRMLSVKAVLLDLHRERTRIQEKSRAPDNDSSRPPTAKIIPLTPREPRGR
jgi:hypothetical protein